MSKTRLILTHTFVQYLSFAISTGLGLVAFGLLTRFLGQEGYGYYTLANVFVHFFGIIADFGLSLVALQIMSEKNYDRQKAFNNIFTIRLVFCIICYSLSSILPFFFPYPWFLRVTIVLISLSFFATALIQIVTTMYQVQPAMLIPSIANIIARLITIAGIWYAGTTFGGLIPLVVAIVFNNIIQLGVLLAFLKRFVRLRLAYDRALWNDIFIRSWPIGASMIFNAIYLKSDAFLLSIFRSPQEVGIYGAAYAVIQVLTQLPFLFLGIVVPHFSHAWSHGDRERLAFYTQRAFDFLMMLALPILAGVCIVGSQAMSFVAGDSFHDAGPILKVLSVALLCVFGSTLFGILINVIHAQRTMLFWYGIIAITSLVGYVIAIPRFSYWGAAGVTILSELAALTATSLLFYSKTHIGVRLATTGRIALASLLMALVLLPLASRLHVLLAIGIGGGLYVGFLYLFGVFPKKLLYGLLKKSGDEAPPSPLAYLE